MTKKKEIAADLRKGILNGTYPPGKNLPGIEALADKYEVAYATVREAISLLANEGLVTPKAGAGTMVRQNNLEGFRGVSGQRPKSWKEQTGGQGQDIVVSSQWEEADEHVSEQLQVAVGDRIVHRVRHLTRGQRVVDICHQWIPENIAQAIKENGLGDLTDEQRPDQEKDLFQLIAATGNAPAQLTETFGARMPSPEEISIMGLAPGVPMFLTARKTVDKNGRPVEACEGASASDQIFASVTGPLNY